jgi:superoxide dismutase
MANLQQGLWLARIKTNAQSGYTDLHALLTIDVWVHAYHLYYKNMRPTFL